MEGQQSGRKEEKKEGCQEKEKKNNTARTMARLQSSSKASQALNNSPNVITTRAVAILLFYTLTTHTLPTDAKARVAP